MTATKLTKEHIGKLIPPRKNNSRKVENGKVLVVGGSYIYHGAPVLSSLAALRSGSDLVYTCVPKINAEQTEGMSPRFMCRVTRTRCCMGAWTRSGTGRRCPFGRRVVSRRGRYPT